MTLSEGKLNGLSPAKRALLERFRKAASAPSAISRHDPNRPAPLSFAQQRLWLAHQLDSESYLFNVPRGLRLRGTLNIAALERSLNEVIRRHEVLRTIFRGDPDALKQVVKPHAPLRLTVENLAPGQLLEEATSAFRLPFDLASGPLLRAHLWQVARNEHVLLIVLHHIVSDAWTAGILFDELSHLYNGSTLPELPAQYADYAAWQRRELAGDRLNAELAWWRTALLGAPPALQLPLDFPRPRQESSRGERLTLVLPVPLLQGLRELSRHENATLYMVLLATYCILLSRWSGQDDIVTGTDFSTRTTVETEQMIGFFINLLPVRVKLTGNPSFRELIARARSAALAVYAHPDLPFEKLVEELQPERVASRHPIVQVLLVMQNIPRSAARMDGLNVDEFDLPFHTSKFDLALFAEEKPEGLWTQWVYHAALFLPETIARMSRHLAKLLADGLANPDVPISALEMMDDAEKAEREQKTREIKQSKLGKLRKTTPVGVDLS